MFKKTLLPLIFIPFALYQSANATQTKHSLSTQQQTLVAKALVYRIKAQTLFEELEDKYRLRGADLDALHHTTLNYLSIKDELEATSNQYQHLIENENGIDERTQMELIMVSLSTMLVRYDNYLLAYKHYEEDKKLRELLNDEDSAYKIPKNTLKDLTNEYNSLNNRQNIQKMIDFYKENIDAFNNVNDDYFLYLKTLIEQSPSYQKGFEDHKSYGLSNINSLYYSSVDFSFGGLDIFSNELSKGFGNSAGLVETRKGKLYDNPAVTEDLESTLVAGDILLEKTPFRLTDKLIPGHWGHAAVYIGTAEELKALGIWNHPIVKKYHNEIEDGKLIDEALRDGVQLNSVEHFLNVDDVAIMRDTQESNEDRANRIILTLRQLGKEYDFNFDIETSDKIVCSELVYATYIKVDWETEKLVGKHTISPDNVAKKTVEENARFIIPLLYHDGEEIKSNKKEKMQELLEDAEEE